MPDNAFDLFMGRHPPVGETVAKASHALWEQSALAPALKEHVRIALADAIGCSYCVRFRTDLDGKPVLEAEGPLDAKTERAVAFARAVVADTTTDEMTVEIQQHFSEAEFTDLVFSIGWFIGMQHVGRIMHWDDSCPVAPIRELVETGEAA